jgi:hypothetical protein
VEAAEWLIPVTVSEFMERFPPRETLPRLAPGSWIQHNFDTWIGEDEENKAWEYLALAREFVGGRAGSLPEDALNNVMQEVYIAEGSDWFWWYGLDQNSGNDQDFDQAFRGTLRRIYALAGAEPPDYLELPISGGAGVALARPISSSISPAIDGRAAAGEWDGAAMVTDREGGSMQRAGGDAIAAFYYGYDAENLYLRFDSATGGPGLAGCDLMAFFSGKDDLGSNVFTGHGKEHTFGFGLAHRVRLNPGNGLQAAVFEAADGEGGWVTHGEVDGAGLEAVEVAVPLKLLGLETGDDLRMGAVAECGDGPVDVLPDRGFIALKMPAIGEAQILRTIADPAGDDHGPGTYTYPTDQVFVDGAFDILGLEVTLDRNQEVSFRLRIGAKPEAVWGGITGYSLQAVDIYIDTDGVRNSGRRDLFKAREARTVADHAWEYFIRASMDSVAMYDAGIDRLDGVDVTSYADPATSSIFVKFPLSAVRDGRTWNVIVAVLSHDGYSEGGIRPVGPVAEQWVLGGCEGGGPCPALVDLVVEQDTSQEEMLGSYMATRSPAEIGGFEVSIP